MTFHEFLIPIASILVPVAVLFVVRGLDKGDKRRQHSEETAGKIEQFMEVHKGHTDWLLRNVEALTNRMSKVEADLNRLLGRMNGSRT